MAEKSPAKRQQEKKSQTWEYMTVECFLRGSNDAKAWMEAIDEHVPEGWEVIQALESGLYHSKYTLLLKRPK